MKVYTRKHLILYEVFKFLEVSLWFINKWINSFFDIFNNMFILVILSD